MSYQIVQSLLQKGISRPTLYQVIMPDVNNDQLEFMVKETAVPAVATRTIMAMGHESMGVIREQPTMIEFGKPFSITVISDRDYIVYKELRDWFESLAQNANPFAGQERGQSQRINYYADITRTITLRKLEQNGDEQYYQPFEIEFNKAYPINIGEISLSTEAVDSKVEFTVDFTYETYTFKDSEDDVRSRL